VLRPYGFNEDHWPDVALAVTVVPELSESAGSGKLAAFGGWPNRAGSLCVNWSRLALGSSLLSVVVRIVPAAVA
jgi:hypothetical protein